MYNLYSGDMHQISKIDKLIPQGNKTYNGYNDIYVKCFLSLIKEALLFINQKCNELSKEDILKIQSVEYVELC